MSDAQDDSLAQLECELLVEKSGARVVIRKAIKKVYDGLDTSALGRLNRIMERWCDDPSKLTPEMFNGNEGRSSRHNVMLQAFKNVSAKIRLYGAAFTVGGRKTFVIVDADVAKKQNKADQKLLGRAKSRLDELIDKFDK